MTQVDLLRRLRAMRGNSGSDGEALDAAVLHIEQMNAQIAQLRGLASRSFRRSTEKVAPSQMAMDFICHVLMLSPPTRRQSLQNLHRAKSAAARSTP